MSDIQATSRQLLHEEIDRIIAEAKATGETLRAAAHAGLLFATYPGARYPIGRIIDQLVLAAAAGLPVESVAF